MKVQKRKHIKERPLESLSLRRTEIQVLLEIPEELNLSQLK
jgi:hypothetical protein